MSSAVTSLRSHLPASGAMLLLLSLLFWPLACVDSDDGPPGAQDASMTMRDASTTMRDASMAMRDASMADDDAAMDPVGLDAGQDPSPAQVVLGTAEDFVILAKAGVSTVPPSAVTGDIGVSPIDFAARREFDTAIAQVEADRDHVAGKLRAGVIRSEASSDKLKKDFDANIHSLKARVDVLTKKL